MKGCDGNASSEAPETANTGGSQSAVEAAVKQVERELDGTQRGVGSSATMDERQQEVDNKEGMLLISTRATVARLNPTNKEATQAEVEAAVRRLEREQTHTPRDAVAQRMDRGPSARRLGGDMLNAAQRASGTLPVVLLSCVVVIAMVTGALGGTSTGQYAISDVIGSETGFGMAQSVEEITSGVLLAANASGSATQSASKPATSSEKSPTTSPSETEHTSPNAASTAPSTAPSTAQSETSPPESPKTPPATRPETADSQPVEIAPKTDKGPSDTRPQKAKSEISPETDGNLSKGNAANVIDHSVNETLHDSSYETDLGKATDPSGGDVTNDKGASNGNARNVSDNGPSDGNTAGAKGTSAEERPDDTKHDKGPEKDSDSSKGNDVKVTPDAPSNGNTNNVTGNSTDEATNSSSSNRATNSKNRSGATNKNETI